MQGLHNKCNFFLGQISNLVFGISLLSLKKEKFRRRSTNKQFPNLKKYQKLPRKPKVPKYPQIPKQPKSTHITQKSTKESTRNQSIKIQGAPKTNNTYKQRKTHFQNFGIRCISFNRFFRAVIVNRFSEPFSEQPFQ